MTGKDFKFLKLKPLVDGELQVVLAKAIPADPVKKYVPDYQFEMRVQGRKAGTIRLRIGRTRPLSGWCGHIGYDVDEKYRGRHFAARACRLIFPIACAHGLRTIWITCDPKNMASRRTCEIAGGKYVDTVPVPKGTEMYGEGKRRVRRYRFDLRTILKMDKVIDDFIVALNMAGGSLDKTKIKIYDLGCPHDPNKLPDGKMAIYIFKKGKTYLKIGKVGPNSNPRFYSQHYNKKGAKSNLANSLLNDEEMKRYKLDETKIESWIKGNTHRIDILLDMKIGYKKEIFVLNYLESFLHCKFNPKYEGKPAKGQQANVWGRKTPGEKV